MGLQSTYASTIGRVAEILETKSSSQNTSRILITVRKFDTGSQHIRLRMPTIHRTEEDTYILTEVEVRTINLSHGVNHIQIILLQNIRLLFNAQHDCERGRCRIVPGRKEKQEREATNRRASEVCHWYSALNTAIPPDWDSTVRPRPRSLKSRGTPSKVEVTASESILR